MPLADPIHRALAFFLLLVPVRQRVKVCPLFFFFSVFSSFVFSYLLLCIALDLGTKIRAHALRCEKILGPRQSRPQRPRSFWSAPRMRTSGINSGIIHMKFRLKNRCDWLLYLTGSVIETGSFRIAINQNSRVKNMKMSL